MRPTKAPLKAFEKALAKAFDHTSSDINRLNAASYGDKLLVAADELLTNQENGRLVMVIDQAEELWAALPLDLYLRKAYIEQQQPFLKLSLSAAESKGRVLVILTMRADFLHRAAEHHELAQMISAHNIIVSPKSVSIRWSAGRSQRRPLTPSSM
jgi:hypothetical protein